MKPDIESGMLFLLQRLTKLPTPERQHKFHPTRKWAFDFAWAGDKKLAIEVEGGIWSRGRSGHSSGAGIQRDMGKSNAAVLEGWRVLRYSVKDLKERPVQVAEEIVKAYNQETHS